MGRNALSMSHLRGHLPATRAVETGVEPGIKSVEDLRLWHKYVGQTIKTLKPPEPDLNFAGADISL